MTCQWRNFVELGQSFVTLSNFPKETCVLISPRCAQLHAQPGYMRRFTVSTPILRHIFSEFHAVQIPQGAYIFHACLDVSGRNSMGLCINPHHLKLGSRGDTRIQAQRTRDQCRQRALWFPDDITDPALPSKRVYSPEITTNPGADAILCWTGSPLPLTAAQERAFRHCSTLFRLPGVANFREVDRALLKWAGRLIREAHRPAAPIDDMLRDYTRQKLPRRPRGQRCSAHRKLFRSQRDCHVRMEPRPSPPSEAIARRNKTVHRSARVDELDGADERFAATTEQARVPITAGV